MSGHVSFNLSNEFGKGDKKPGLFTLKSHFCRKKRYNFVTMYSTLYFRKI